ncbi:AraC family transcriptional regulator [Chryseobacterium sp. T16E-39]|uniref:helix-turn-helix domain-containing protein n=1 Tax=Chryseobacterium sp. T16E-39 TaxID=2015076 RepID=UPI000B5B4371|nr:helix-turn-helix domain-containing protein [Chryseobacterium sp. T16E-39]ASK28906.1 AraC family transcriptional regulator [Chryseobacterium sp. T16E-39]
MFYLAGIFIAFFSSFLILGKKKKAGADYLLALWFFIIGLHLTLVFLNFFGSYIQAPYLLGLEIPLPLIHGPMLFLYILNLSGQGRNPYLQMLHFLPALAVYLILWNFFMLSPKEKMVIYENGGMIYKGLRKGISMLVYISGISYVTLSLLSLQKYKKKISRQYSNIEKINLNWVYYLIIGISIVWASLILKNDTITFTSVVLFVLFTAYFGITKAGILNLPELKTEYIENEKIINETEVAVKYQKSGLTDENIQMIYDRLSQRMKSEKLFKDPDLNMNTIASLLEIHPNTLSQVINTIENKNFYDYINTQRIDEFKRIAVLPENQKFTILTLAFESGFNSKTSFNRNFKKYVQCSPRDFLKNQNLELE